MIHAGHLPENRIRIDDEGRADRTPGDAQRYRLKMSDWQTALILTYSLDECPDLRPATRGGRRLVRHLCVQVSLDGRYPPGPVTEKHPSYSDFLAFLSLPVEQFFEDRIRDGGADISTSLRIGTPIPIADPQTHQVGWRTPVLAHFLCPVTDPACPPFPTPPRPERQDAANGDFPT